MPQSLLDSLTTSPLLNIGLGLLEGGGPRNPSQWGGGLNRGLLNMQRASQLQAQRQQQQQLMALRQQEENRKRLLYDLEKAKNDRELALLDQQRDLANKMAPNLTAAERFALTQGGAAAAKVIEQRSTQPGVLQGTGEWSQTVNGIVNSYPPEMRDQVRLELLIQGATQPTFVTRPDGSIVERPGLQLPPNPGVSPGISPSVPPGMSQGMPRTGPSGMQVHEKPLGAEAANFRDSEGNIPDARLSVREATEGGFRPLTESERKSEEKLQTLGVKAKEGMQVINKFQEKLNNYEKAFSESGTEYWPGAKKAKLESALTDLQLELKNLAELGVLAGEDLTLIEKLTGTPTGVKSNLLGVVGLDATDQKIESMKEMLNSTYRALAKKSAGIPGAGAIFTGEPYKIGGPTDPSTGRPSKNLKFNPQTGKLE